MAECPDETHFLVPFPSSLVSWLEAAGAIFAGAKTLVETLIFAFTRSLTWIHFPY
jgi:hypothetical protein